MATMTDFIIRPNQSLKHPHHVFGYLAIMRFRYAHSYRSDNLFVRKQCEMGKVHA